jgi:hypothetical protein
MFFGEEGSYTPNCLNTLVWIQISKKTLQAFEFQKDLLQQEQNQLEGLSIDAVIWKKCLVKFGLYLSVTH